MSTTTESITQTARDFFDACETGKGWAACSAYCQPRGREFTWTQPDAPRITTGRALVAVRDWTFLLGPGLMPGINALLLGYLMYRSGLVPRLIPVVGLIGAPLLIASATAALFRGDHLVPVLAVIATIPIFVWELSLGLWLVLKGFKPSPITAGMAAPTGGA